MLHQFDVGSGDANRAAQVGVFVKGVFDLSEEFQPCSLIRFPAAFAPAAAASVRASILPNQGNICMIPAFCWV
jgi:hypothetical protein